MKNRGHFEKNSLQDISAMSIIMVIGKELYFIRVWPMDTFYSHLMNRN